MKLRTLALALGVLALALPTFAADTAEHVKPGKWTVTMTMDMPGMPMKIPPVTINHCITKEEAENPQPPKSQKDKNCEITDYKRDGNTVTWTVKCTGDRPMTGEGKMTFHPESYEGTTHMKMGDMDVTQKFTGKYVGECDK